MNWFLRLKLANKLLLTFLICSALTAAVGVFGLLRVAGLGAMLDSVYRDNVLAAQYVSDAASRFGAHSRAYVRLPAMKDAETVKATIDRAQSHMDKFQKSIEAYRATNLQPNEVQLVKLLDTQLPVYKAQSDKVAALAGAGKAAEAAELSNGDARKATTAVEDTLDKLIDELAAQAKATNEAGAQTIASTRTVLIAVVAGSVLLAIALGLVVTRIVSRQIGGEPAVAADIVRRVADGDLSAQIALRHGDSNSMLYAVQQMVGRLKQVIDGQRAVVEAANRGNFQARVDLQGLQGFQKEMGEGLNQLVTTTGGSIADVVRVMEAVSGGDLTRTIDADYDGAFGEMKTYVNNTVAKLSEVVAEVNSGAESLAGASEEVSATAQSLSQASSEQAAGVEETSASMEQMTASISQNTE
ncbi:MAG: MCP four helix bundle domain-containing protein, partial [Rubrivivax sp.]